MFTNTDEAFAGFCQYCATAPDKCLLAQNNRTAEQISEFVVDTLEELKFNPIPIAVPGSGRLVDYTTIRTRLIYALYSPSTWPSLDAILYNVSTKNTTALAALLTPAAMPSSIPKTESLYGIRCSDIVPRVAELSGIQDLLDARYKLSKIGGDLWDPNTMVCAQWKFAAKERVLPQLETIQTKHPIMLVNNRYDPATPLVNARNTSARFDGSVVLETNGYGVRIVSSEAPYRAHINC